MTWSTESRHKRGYGAAWGKLRLTILARDNRLCQCPDCKGGDKRVTLATEVHHIVSKAEGKRRGWTDAQIDHPSNLASMSHACHEKQDQINQGAKPRQRIGADGWPAPE